MNEKVRGLKPQDVLNAAGEMGSGGILTHVAIARKLQVSVDSVRRFFQRHPALLSPKFQVLNHLQFEHRQAMLFMKLLAEFELLDLVNLGRLMNRNSSSMRSYIYQNERRKAEYEKLLRRIRESSDEKESQK